MNGMEYNSNYIGVECDNISGLHISIKYSGNAEKSVNVVEGQMAYVGYISNVQGKLNHITAVGVVRKIGCDPVPRTAFIGGYPQQYPTKQNPYWIELDCSTESNSDIRSIYVRDIRDITVGRSPIDPAVPEICGFELPKLTEANISFYAGRMFTVNPRPPKDKPPMFHGPYDRPCEEHHHHTRKDQPGIYYCTGAGWVQLTVKQDLLSSPLVRPLDLVGRSDHIPMTDIFELSDKVLIGPKNQKRDLNAIGGMLVQEYFNEDEHGINSSIELVGNTVTIRLDTTGLTDLFTEYTNICKIPKGFYPKYTGEVYTNSLIEEGGDFILYEWYIDADGLWVRFPEVESITVDEAIGAGIMKLTAMSDENTDTSDTTTDDSNTDSATDVDDDQSPEIPPADEVDPPKEEEPPVDNNPDDNDQTQDIEPEIDPFKEALLLASKNLMFKYDI